MSLFGDFGATLEASLIRFDPKSCTCVLKVALRDAAAVWGALTFIGSINTHPIAITVLRYDPFLNRLAVDDRRWLAEC